MAVGIRIRRAPNLPAGDFHPGQLPWDRVDTVAVLGGGPMWDEPPFYRAFDAVLDNEGDAVFLVNGGDGELIRYDIGSGRTSRIGRRGSGPGEFGRPVWLEPHGPDSLLAYDMSLGRFSVFSRSGDFGRIFMLPGDGGRGRHVAAMTRMGARVWAALSLGTPPGLMGLETPLETPASSGSLGLASCSMARCSLNVVFMDTRGPKAKASPRGAFGNSSSRCCGVPLPITPTPPRSSRRLPLRLQPRVADRTPR